MQTVLALGMVTVIAAGISPAVGETSNHSVEQAPIAAAPVETQSCISPTPEDFEHVDEARSDNTRPDLRDYSYKSGKKADAERDKLKDQLHLVFHEYTPEVTADPKRTLDNFRVFAGKYGLTVAVETANPKEAPTEAELNSQSAVNSINEVGNSLSKLPEVYIKKTEVKQITFFSNVNSDHEVLDYVNQKNADRAIHMNINTANSRLPHESFHLLDGLECGPDNMYVDPVYNAINGQPNIYQNAWPVPALTPEQSRMSNELFTARQYGIAGKLVEAGVDYDTAMCRASIKLAPDAANVLTATSYGLNRIIEDKADLGEQLLDPMQHNKIFDDKKPKLFEKARLEAARLWHLMPAYAEYLLVTGQLPNKCS